MVLSQGILQKSISKMNLTKPLSDPKIQTLLICYDTPPSDHDGPYLLLKDIGAPNPTKVTHAFTQVLRTHVAENDPNSRYAYSISLEDDPRAIELFPAVMQAVKIFDAGLGSYEDSMMGVRNTFANMDLILKYPDISQASLTAGAAILLSAGPSIELEWNEIKRAYDSGKFFIVAVDAILSRALEKGVIPDVVVTSERVSGTEDFLDVEAEKLPLLVSTVMSYRPTIDIYRGPKSFVFRSDYASSWYPLHARKMIGSAPSVAPTAVGIMGLLGLKKILLCGQDLSLDPMGVTHANLGKRLEKKKEFLQKEESKMQSRENEVCDNYAGSTSKTTNAWKAMGVDMTMTVRQWDLEVVSSSLYGMVMQEVAYESSKSFIDRMLEEGLPDKYFHYPDKNLYEKKDRLKFESKVVQAKKSLSALEDKLGEVEPNHFLDLPHFNQLCKSAMQRVMVTYWNKVFQNRGDCHEFRVIVRGEALCAIRDILKILDGDFS